MRRQRIKTAGLIYGRQEFYCILLRYGVKTGKKKEAAKEWIDFLAAAGQKIWQILPLNPPGLGDSPYLSVSAFAGHETLFAGTEEKTCDTTKEMISSANKNIKEKEQQKYLAFCQKNSYWLPDYALFRALQDYFHKPWQEWPEEIRTRQSAAVKKYEKLLEKQTEIFKRKQFEFFCAWQDIKAYANAKGIEILGDMPIFVAADSADCWAHPEYFYLDEEGYPEEAAGVPPDYFSATGQIWGNLCTAGMLWKKTGSAGGKNDSVPSHSSPTGSG